MRSAVVFLVVVLSAVVPVGSVGAQPQIPATFFGSASIDGKAPPADTDVRAFVGDLDCTQPGQQARFAIENGVGQYVLHVMHESQKPGCGRDGVKVTFRVGGREANVTGAWKAGPNLLNLNAGSGVAAALPSATSTATRAEPTAGITRTTSAVPSSGSPSRPATSDGRTPTIIVGDGRGVAGGGSSVEVVRPLVTVAPAAEAPSAVPADKPASGSGIWPLLLGSFFVVAVVSGVGGAWYTRRGRRGGGQAED